MGGVGWDGTLTHMFLMYVQMVTCGLGGNVDSYREGVEWVGWLTFMHTWTSMLFGVVYCGFGCGNVHFYADTVVYFIQTHARASVHSHLVGKTGNTGLNGHNVARTRCHLEKTSVETRARTLV
jgi:hypothetical protein